MKFSYEDIRMQETGTFFGHGRGGYLQAVTNQSKHSFGLLLVPCRCILKNKNKDKNKKQKIAGSRKILIRIDQKSITWKFLNTNPIFEVLTQKYFNVLAGVLFTLLWDISREQNSWQGVEIFYRVPQKLKLYWETFI